MTAVIAAAVAGVLLWLLGAHHGRVTERRRIAQGKASARGVTPLAVFEADLRRSKGLPRMHPDPENAAHVYKARIRR